MIPKKFNFAKYLFIFSIVFYVIIICGILFTVILNSISKKWYDGFFPKIFTTEWYKYVLDNHDIPNLLQVTFLVVVAVVGISLLIAYPAAYAMVRGKFRFKGLILTLFLLPIIIPPMTYGLPLASVLYKVGLAGNISGVIIANLVPIVPFMILILIPFIEQVGENLESAARMLGASKLTIFLKILLPMTLPGMFTAIILSVVKTISMFELTFLVAGGKSQTIIVALFSDVFASGFRPYQAVDALAVIYFVITMLCFVVSLKFVSPTQMVFRV